MINCHAFANLKSGTLLLAQSAQTDAGFWMDIEPVIAADLNAEVAVRDAFEAIQTNDVVRIGTPPRDAHPAPVVLQHARIRTWIELERKYCQFSVWTQVEDSSIKIEGWKPALDSQGMEPDPGRVEVLPKGSTIQDLTCRFLAMIEALRADPDNLPVRS